MGKGFLNRPRAGFLPDLLFRVGRAGMDAPKLELNLAAALIDYG
jgi:hypothetical protein